VCQRVVVEGKVQGVGFRAWAQRKACSLGIRGWIRNLSDGRVEALLCGESSLLEEMRRLLARGPAGAEVRGIRVTEAHCSDSPYFEVRPTV
jgi:acylphosphatase